MSTSEPIQLQQSLACGMIIESALCGKPTTLAYITPDTTDTVPDERSYYRLLPVCETCQQNLTTPPILISEFDQTFTGRPNWEWE